MNIVQNTARLSGWTGSLASMTCPHIAQAWKANLEWRIQSRELREDPSSMTVIF